MAGRKKQEIALQQEIETQEEWEELLTKEGLIVIEVYQEWAGTSPACLGVIKEVLIKVNNDKMLKLATAKADTIDSLERYRGKCQPCFLFYAGGSLVAVIRGANSPVLSRMLITELAKEHKVLNGEAERLEIRDPAFAHLDEQEKASMDEDETEKEEDAPSSHGYPAHAEETSSPVCDDLVPREITVALLKPDIVAAGKTDEVLEKMTAAGIEILKHEERQLTEEEAKDFYGHLSSEPFFDELVKFMSGGPSHVLVLSKAGTGKGILDEWRELIGPTSVEEAKEKAPESLRAQYGDKEMLNALHGSDSYNSAVRELAFFFPDYQVPMVKGGRGRTPRHKQQSGIQRTLALIRPDALVDKKDEILQSIKEAGFTIALQKEIQLTEEQAKEFYKEHTDQPYFDELIGKMTSGPVLALGLAREDAIEQWRNLLGPKTVSDAKETAPQSLRAQYSIEGTEVNMLHGSDTPGNADKELEYFFPMQQTVAVIKPEAYDNKDAIMEKIKEAGFHIAARKETTLTKEIASMMYKDNAEKEYYNGLIDHMTSGPTLFMVLSKNDAVENWRSVIGPTDPNVAKEQAPESIRAQFGTDIKANAIHAPTTADNAQTVIKEMFGEVEFTKDGQVNKDSSKLKEGVEVTEEEEEQAKSPEPIAEAPEGTEAEQQEESEKPKTPAPAAEGEKPATPAPAAEGAAGEEEKPTPAAEEKAASRPASAAAEEGKAATPAPAEGEAVAPEGEATEGAKAATPAPAAEEEKAATPAPAEGEKAATPAPTEGEKAATPAPAEGEKAATPVPAAEEEKAPTPAPAEGEKAATPAPAADSSTPTAAAEEGKPAEDKPAAEPESEQPASPDADDAPQD